LCPLHLDPSNHANTNELALCRCEHPLPRRQRAHPRKTSRDILQASGNFATNSGTRCDHIASGVLVASWQRRAD
ncbi:MAG: hypothetical protein ACRD3W_30035, partial [Terriglobales bacterium]